MNAEQLAHIGKALPGRVIQSVEGLPGISFLAKCDGIPDTYGWFIDTQAESKRFDGVHIRLADFITGLRLTADVGAFYAVVVHYSDDVVAAANIKPFFPIPYEVTVRSTGVAVVHIGSRSLKEIR